MLHKLIDFAKKLGPCRLIVMCDEKCVSVRVDRATKDGEERVIWSETSREELSSLHDPGTDMLMDELLRRWKKDVEEYP